MALATMLMLLRMPPADGHAYAATILVLGSYVLFHALLSALMQGNLIARSMAGYISAERRAELPIVRLWADYLLLIAATGLCAAQLPGVFG